MSNLPDEITVTVDAAEFYAFARATKRGYHASDLGEVVFLVLGKHLLIETKRGACKLPCQDVPPVLARMSGGNFLKLVSLVTDTKISGPLSMTFRPTFGEVALPKVGVKAVFDPLPPLPPPPLGGPAPSPAHRSAKEVAAELQLLYRERLPAITQYAADMLSALPAKQPQVLYRVAFSAAERSCILLETIVDLFQEQLDTGYYASAALTRSLFETATLLATLSSDGSGAASSLLASAEAAAVKRHDCLARMRSAKDPEIARCADRESTIAAGVTDALQQIRTQAGLPAASGSFPDVFTRCQRLGESWEFLYHAVYRDLCDAVHVSFVKTPHSPSLAALSPNKGDALIYEHCRTVGYAIEFWASSMIEYCRTHPNPAVVSAFRSMISSLIKHEERLFADFPPTTKNHSFHC